MGFALVGAIVTSFEFGSSQESKKEELYEKLIDNAEAETKETLN